MKKEKIGLIFFLQITIVLLITFSNSVVVSGEISEITYEWESKTPSPSPQSENNYLITYDNESDRVLLFSGYDGAGTVSQELWAYDTDNNMWEERASPGFSRVWSSIAYDSESDLLVTYGGYTEFWGTQTSETWIYDYNADQWQNKQPTTRPTAMLGHQMAYYDSLDRIILYGGFYFDGAENDYPQSETWSYDINSNTWTNLQTVIHPQKVAFHSMAYDSESDKIILFGGMLSSNAKVQETWTYDFTANNWTNLQPTIQPPATAFHSMVYDAESDQIILFGGETSTGASDAIWLYDYNTNEWWKKYPTSAPPASILRPIAYDIQSDRCIHQEIGKTWLFRYGEEVKTTENSETSSMEITTDTSDDPSLDESTIEPTTQSSTNWYLFSGFVGQMLFLTIIIRKKHIR